MEYIGYLPSRPDLVRTIAGWHQETWGHLTGRSVEERIAEFGPQLESRVIPLTLVAFSGSRPAGTVSLLGDDMDTHPELTPWLASVYVPPEFRRRGIGERLCRRAVAEAERLAVKTLYLFTEDQAAFYRRMGWEPLAVEEYRGEEVTLMKIVPGNRNPPESNP